MKYIHPIKSKALQPFLVIFSLFLFFATETTYAQEQNAIAGIWLIQDKDAKVEIFEKGDKFYGKIYWMKYPKDENGNDKVDEKNPDPALRSRKKQDLLIMTGFVYSPSDKEWNGGTIYDSKSGKTYDGYMKLQEDGTLYMKGFILGIRFLGRSNIWTRVED